MRQGRVVCGKLINQFISFIGELLNTGLHYKTSLCVFLRVPTFETLPKETVFRIVRIDVQHVFTDGTPREHFRLPLPRSERKKKIQFYDT